MTGSASNLSVHPIHGFRLILTGLAAAAAHSKCWSERLRDDIGTWSTLVFASVLTAALMDVLDKPTEQCNGGTNISVWVRNRRAEAFRRSSVANEGHTRKHRPATSGVGGNHNSLNPVQTHR